MAETATASGANRRGWTDYLDAELGLRNFWYVACFSREIQEGQVVVRKILGESILLRRVRGEVRAIRDRCIHRGVKFSDKIECYTPETITCWYHGFTFRWEDGVVDSVFASPDSKVVKQRRVKTYPVVEAKGLVFVFVGDEGYVPPPLSHDVPPDFLDDDLVLVGESQIVNANWQLGPEGGIDECHRYLHRESPLLLEGRKSMPLGHRAAFGQVELVEEPAGPRGIIDRFRAEQMFFEAKIGDKTVVRSPNFGPEGRQAVFSSAWMPACAKVVGFPDTGLTSFEWYVPIDEVSHRCFMTLTKVCETDEDAAAFGEEFDLRWRPLALDGFLSQDVKARESQQEFYSHREGWKQETLLEDDKILMEWRKLCSRNHRGIQTRDHTV